MHRTFQMGKDRIWAVERQGRKLVVRWGKLGGKQQTREKALLNELAAELDVRQQVKKKLAEGYKETTPKGELPPLGATGQGLAAALTDDPDDAAGHMAFADWLSEQADARLRAWGEFVRVQLALEAAGLTAAQRRKLRARESELRQAGQRDWLGEDLAQYLLELRTDHLPKFLQEVVNLHQWTFARGWLNTLTLGCLTKKLAEALARSPALRLCRTLTVRGFAGRGDVFAPLANSSHLVNVRTLALEVMSSSHVPAPLVACMPRLQELSCAGQGQDFAPMLRLPTLGRLRTLHLGGFAPASLAALADNPALAGVRTLGINTPVVGGDEDTRDDYRVLTVHRLLPLFRSPYLGGLRELTVYFAALSVEGCAELVGGGLLGRLEVLDLSYCHITDPGAAILAGSPDLPRLRALTVTGNHLTAAGMRRLRQTGVKVVSRYQDRFEDFDPDWE